MKTIISDTFTESDYTISYYYIENICTVNVRGDHYPSSNVSIFLKQKLTKKPKYRIRVQNYKGKNSWLQIAEDGSIYIEHSQSDAVWFDATITFLCA